MGTSGRGRLIYNRERDTHSSERGIDSRRKKSTNSRFNRHKMKVAGWNGESRMAFDNR